MIVQETPITAGEIIQYAIEGGLSYQEFEMPSSGMYVKLENHIAYLKAQLSQLTQAQKDTVI